MKLKQIIRGLEIASRYRGDICAEHDVIYIHCSDRITVGDLMELESAGWVATEDVESWKFFV